jgi:hypothetical protein
VDDEPLAVDADISAGGQVFDDAVDHSREAPTRLAISGAHQYILRHIRVYLPIIVLRRADI